MALTLGIDTSNYASSAALYDEATGRVVMKRRLLPVPDGTVGLRQSDAVFAHVKQLSSVVREMTAEYGAAGAISAVGVSVSPRRAEGSYMPCFLVGQMVAESIAAVLGVPVRECSHQEGHILAALYSSGSMEWIKNRFLAFHVSGGTTEVLLVEPDETHIIHETCVAATLDLNAGQLIDRVGARLGCGFPAGPELERLAATCTETIRVRATAKEGGVCLSGVQNQCETLLQKGKDAAYVARFCLESVGAALEELLRQQLSLQGPLSVLFAGGVMSNQLIRKGLSEITACRFAEPAFSADNAAGVAILASLKGKNDE